MLKRFMAKHQGAEKYKKLLRRPLFWWSLFLLIVLIVSPSVGVWLFIISGLVLLWLRSQKNRREKNKLAVYAPLALRSQEIIQESIEIIKKTENFKTGIGRFETIKTVLKRLFDFRRKIGINDNFKMTLGVVGKDWDIAGDNDLDKIDEAMGIWLKAFLDATVKEQRERASAVSDLKLKRREIKKAIDLALKILPLIKSSEKVKKIIGELEKEAR